MFFNNSAYFLLDKELKTSAGENIKVYKLNKETLNDECLNEWALGLRSNYVEEQLIDSLIKGTGLTKKEYLETNIFPNPNNSLGAATMSGEFGEILVYDFINYVLTYYVTRTRYLEKINPDMPISGTDVIGCMINDINHPNIKDNLLVAEVKTRSSISGKKMRLEDNPLKSAILDSNKDKIRLAESLNAEKRRLMNRCRYQEAKIVERFQNKTDNPYNLKFLAVAVLDSFFYSEEFILNVINNLENEISNKNILIIHSVELKKFLRDLYMRACIC